MSFPVRFRRNYGFEAICFIAFLAFVTICMATALRGEELGFLNAREKEASAFNLPGHIWSDKFWRVDFDRAVIKPHDFYFFVALNLRYKDSKTQKVMWLAPVWSGKNGGWQPSAKPPVIYVNRFVLKSRRLCPPGMPCKKVKTWVQKKDE